MGKKKSRALYPAYPSSHLFNKPTTNFILSVLQCSKRESTPVITSYLPNLLCQHVLLVLIILNINTNTMSRRAIQQLVLLIGHHHSVHALHCSSMCEQWSLTTELTQNKNPTEDVYNLIYTKYNRLNFTYRIIDQQHVY